MAGSLSRLDRFRSKTKVTPTSVVELRHAGDVVVCAHLERERQTIVGAFTEAYETMGLTISISKTKLRHQHNLDTPCIYPPIRIYRKLLESFDHFPYLGSRPSSKASIDGERRSSASAAFGRLQIHVF